MLEERGLAAALRAVADRSPIPVELEVDVEPRLADHLEAAAYYVVCEALANVAKHARASTVRIRVRREDGGLAIEVSDDGAGGADPAAGSGLRGLADRVEALDGRLLVESAPGAGTRLLARIPAPGRRLRGPRAQSGPRSAARTVIEPGSTR